MIKFVLVLMLAGVLGGFSSLSLAASSWFSSGLTEKLVRLAKKSGLSAQDAARQAQARFGGKVVSVRLKRPSKGRPYYRVKLLSKGNVRVVRIDAEP